MFIIKIFLTTFLMFLFYVGVTCQQSVSKTYPTFTPTQSPYIRKDSIGVKPKVKESDTTSFETYPVPEWLNKRFIFMLRQTPLKKYGYQLIQSIDQNYEKFAYEDFGIFGTIAYENYVGKIVKVIAVTPKNKDFSEDKWAVYLQVEGTKKKLKAHPVNKTINGLACLQDIDDARNKYLGKTLLLKQQVLMRYDTVSDIVEFFKVPEDTLVKVIDIVVSWNQEAPVRFIVQTPQKEEGFMDVNLSGTNISEVLRRFDQFNTKFVLVN